MVAGRDRATSRFQGRGRSLLARVTETVGAHVILLELCSELKLLSASIQVKIHLTNNLLYDPR